MDLLGSWNYKEESFSITVLHTQPITMGHIGFSQSVTLVTSRCLVAAFLHVPEVSGLSHLLLAASER
jgi:hypothetical protein